MSKPINEVGSLLPQETRVADPDPTCKKNPDPAVKKKPNRIRPNVELSFFHVKVNMIDSIGIMYPRLVAYPGGVDTNRILPSRGKKTWSDPQNKKKWIRIRLNPDLQETG